MTTPLTLTVLDLETTGFSPTSNEILQIAAARVRADRWEIESSFNTFVRIKGRIPGVISQLTGITQADVARAPGIREALLGLADFVGESHAVIAHNGKRFDMPFIRESCARHDLAVREIPFVDSMALSRKCWGGTSGHGMDALLQRLGLDAVCPGYQRHDARGDVDLLIQAIARMRKTFATFDEQLAALSVRLPFPTARRKSA
jgi:DNA polymerase-3 subunit epsilon